MDADKFCNVTWFFGYKSGQVISCLRDVKNQVTKKCKDQLFKIQMDVSGPGPGQFGNVLCMPPAMHVSSFNKFQAHASKQCCH